MSENISEKDKRIFEENIKLHKSEADFYEVQHPEIFNFLEQRRIRKEVTRIRENLPIKEVICVDVGSGTGNLIPHLKSVGFKVIACDLSVDMLKWNEAEHKILCEARYLPIRNGTCHLIVAFSVLHHLPNECIALKEFCRITTKPAILYFDHDIYITEGKKRARKLKRNKIFQFLAYMLWVTTKPHSLKKLMQYALWGRKKHLRYIQNVNWKLTDNNPVNMKELKETLNANGFKVKMFAYKPGGFSPRSLIRAVKKCK